MGKNFFKFFVVIVFFPVAIIFFILRKIFCIIRRNIISSYLSTINIESIDSLSGVDFEELMYYLFTNIGFKVTRTNKSHDYGADLILEISNVRMILQCKLYYKHNVGLSAVQEVYSSLKYYNGDIAIVLTNSNFSNSAINLARNTNVLLWDRNILKRLLKLNNHEKIAFKNKLKSFTFNPDCTDINSKNFI